MGANRFTHRPVPTHHGLWLPLFEAAFLAYLDDVGFCCDVDAIPEGTVVFPHQPLLRVQGSILQAQLVETALLNILNFKTACLLETHFTT